MQSADSSISQSRHNARDPKSDEFRSAFPGNRIILDGVPSETESPQPRFQLSCVSAPILRDTIRAVGMMRETNRILQLTCEKVVKNGGFVYREVQKTAIGGLFDAPFSALPADRLCFASTSSFRPEDVGHVRSLQARLRPVRPHWTGSPSFSVPDVQGHRTSYLRPGSF